jgi:NADPH:quinone reductase-like Zn-dependent oxidoreductase
MFIYGGSTSLGLFAIQFAKIAGYRVIVACSPKSFKLVKEYGADEAVDVRRSIAFLSTARHRSTDAQSRLL